FFQAEDGIRDLTVTGVQTCALPIFDTWLVCHARTRSELEALFPRIVDEQDAGVAREQRLELGPRARMANEPGVEPSPTQHAKPRSEEGRVGKGWSGGRELG